MSWGFDKLCLEASSQESTAISTPFGSFKWLVIIMGPTGSPLVFQYLLEKVLVGLTWKSIVQYIDDCIIFSRTAEEHIERFRDVFQRFKETRLKITPPECEFFQQNVLSWVTFLIETEIKPIQPIHQLCASMQYRNRLLKLKVSRASVLTTDGTFKILPQLLDLFIS